MSPKNITRRDFIKSTAVVTGAAVFSSPYASQAIPAAEDLVPLGKTGLKLTRIGFGTGTLGGTVQRSLTTDEFNRLIRYAYDRGIRYIDTAENYQTHSWVREAIQGLPRERLFILSKMPRIPDNPLETLDRYRSELGVDYIDTVLVHAVQTPDWNEERKVVLDALEEAKQKQIIRAHGVSCHSLTALRKAAELDWVDVNLVRINPQGVKVDMLRPARGVSSDASHVPDVVEQIQVMRDNGHGVLGMKIIGEGDLTSREDREKSIRYVIQNGLVDAFTIGFKNTGEIDEVIRLTNQALIDKG
jgi:aryl-alcohol dehydrogenase-like predicted oxidoreductase